MPRIGRTPLPGVVHHVITRFVDHSWLLAGDEEREAYLFRLGRALKRTDWKLLAYALMSNHVHLVLEAGHSPLGAWAKSVHSGMARWLNIRRRGLGPVFADRPYAEAIEPERVPYLIAYVHNNPVRAGVVPWAGDCDWTTHRAYLGVETAASVDIARGLELCGYAADPDCFDEWVRACAQLAELDGFNSQAQTRAALRSVRKWMGAPARLAAPKLTSDGRQYPILIDLPATVAPARIEADPFEVLRYVHAMTGVDPLGTNVRDHRPVVSRARRVALLAWHATGRARVEMARAIGITHQAAGHLVRCADAQSHAIAERVATALGLGARFVTRLAAE